jgi:hypothetical protein
MTITDPSTSVSDKPKQPRASHKNVSNAPNYTSRDYVDVEANQFSNFHDDAEEKYLNRIKLRSKLMQIAPDSVPAPSTFEAMLQKCNSELNQLYQKGDTGSDAEKRLARANLEILYAKFGTTNLFNIANSIATSRLQKASIKEYDAMINKPDSAVDAILGVKTDSTQQKIREAKILLNQQGTAYYVRPSLFGMTKAQADAFAAATV